MPTHETILARLSGLCSRAGGYKVVAEAAGVSADNLRQVLQGAKLPSGELRSLGRRVQDRITTAYPDWLNQQHTVAGSESRRGEVAQVMSHPMDSYSPQFTWEALRAMQTIPASYRVTAPDDSMLPRVRRGDVLEFNRDETPRSGDGVLVRDRDGNLYFRVYRQAHPGSWQAHPMNADFLPLDSELDGLTVVGVMVGAPRHRWG